MQGGLIGSVVEQLRGALGRGLAEFETVLDALPQGVVVRDRDGGTVFANQRAVAILGMESVAELMDTPLERLSQRYEFFDEFGARAGRDGASGRPCAARRGRERRRDPVHGAATTGARCGP